MSKRVSNLADVISHISKILLVLLGLFAVIYSRWYVESGMYLEDGGKANAVFDVAKHFYGIDMKKVAETTIEEQINKLDATVALSQKTLHVSDEEAVLSDNYQTPEQTVLTREIQETERVIRRITESPIPASKWVYAGAIDNETGLWKTKYFEFSSLVIGGDYVATQAINVRATPPSKDTGTWQKGKVIGGLLEGDRFKVKSILEVPGTHNRTLFWGEIETL